LLLHKCFMKIIRVLLGFCNSTKTLMCYSSCTQPEGWSPLRILCLRLVASLC